MAILKFSLLHLATLVYARICTRVNLLIGFYSSWHRIYNSTLFRVSITLLEPPSLKWLQYWNNLQSFLQNFSDMKTARAPEEGIRHHNIPNWAILYHEGKELSPRRMASASCPQQKDWIGGFLSTLAHLVKRLKLCYPNKLGILKNCTLYA